MTGFFILAVCVCLLASRINNRSYSYNGIYETVKYDGQARFLFVTMLISVVLFSALRTTYNDTVTYMQGYQFANADIIRIEQILEPYGGFYFFQSFLKHYISDDPQTLIVCSSIIVNLLFLGFIIRKSQTLTASMYYYLIGMYLFSMAGIKQGIAIAISLISISQLLERHFFRFFVFLLLAALFHPYIICLAILPLLTRKAWDGKTIIVIIISLFCFSNLERLLNIISLFGQEYTMDVLTATRINPMRVVVESLPVIISIVFKNRINNSGNKIVVLGVNMQILSFLFVAMGLFANPIYFARIGTYFSAISMVTIPLMLYYSFYDSQNEEMYHYAYYAFSFIYFLLDATKLGRVNIFVDQFNHISLFSLI